MTGYKNIMLIALETNQQKKKVKRSVITAYSMNEWSNLNSLC